MTPETSLVSRVAILAEVAREQLADPHMGNWFSTSFSHGDYNYQYAFYYERGALIAEQCNNVCPMAALNVQSRARKQSNFGNRPTIFLLAVDHRQRQGDTTRWRVIRELLFWLWHRRWSHRPLHKPRPPAGLKFDDLRVMDTPAGSYEVKPGHFRRRNDVDSI